MKKHHKVRSIVRRVGFVLASSFIIMTSFVIILSFLYWAVEGDQKAYLSAGAAPRTFFDWFYFTIITTRTIGFGDITVKTQLGKGLTIFNALLPASIFFGASMVILDRFFIWLQNRYRRFVMQRHKHHHVIVADPDLMESIVAEYDSESRPYVCITESTLENLSPPLRDTLDDHNHLVGDATRDEVLQAANLPQADAIVIATEDDNRNLFVLVTAKQIAPQIKTIVRVNRPEIESKFKAVGADTLLPSGMMLGRMLTQAASRPVALDLLVRLQTRTAAPSLEEVQVSSQETGKGVRECYNKAVAVYRSGSFLFDLDELQLQEDDTVLRISQTAK